MSANGTSAATGWRLHSMTGCIKKSFVATKVETLLPLARCRKGKIQHDPANNGCDWRRNPKAGVVMFDGALTGTHDFTPSLRSDNRTTEGYEAMSRDRQSNDCWGERAIFWLRQRYVNWPIKAIARDLDEPESVVKSWWMGGRPSREKLQKLDRRFAHEGFRSFVFGAPSREEVTARLETLNKNLSELRVLLNEAARMDRAPFGLVRGKA